MMDELDRAIFFDSIFLVLWASRLRTLRVERGKIWVVAFNLF